MSVESEQPWYRQPWAWFVLSPLIVVILACAVTVTLAYRYADDVVIDNYYKEGLMVNQRLEQDQQARELGLSGELRFDLEVGEVLLSLHTSPREDNGLPEKLLLFLNHPTSARSDRRLELVKASPGRYRADLEFGLSGNKWYVLLLPAPRADREDQSAQWRLTGDIDLQRQSRLVFDPS